MVMSQGKYSGKTIEKSLNTLYYVKNKKIFVHCQREGWCTSEIFAYWINEIFLPYENEISEKCLLIMDNASSHISNTTLNQKLFVLLFYLPVSPLRRKSVCLLFSLTTWFSRRTRRLPCGATRRPAALSR